MFLYTHVIPISILFQSTLISLSRRHIVLGASPMGYPQSMHTSTYIHTYILYMYTYTYMYIITLIHWIDRIPVE